MVNFSGLWILSDSEDTNPGSSGSAARRVNSPVLSIAGSIPLGRPEDVEGVPGAFDDASAEIPDFVTLSLSQLTYRTGGGIQSYGIRARVTGSLRGFEAVGYYQPLFSFFANNRASYGAEFELGWREGNAEFTNLTTRSPDRGNLVARTGAFVEWAPELGPINRDLTRGLRFFVRGRGWLDTYDDDAGSQDWRFRSFVDSELFWNFEEGSRIFLRHETGYLPPDFGSRVNRTFIGTGIAF